AAMANRETGRWVTGSPTGGGGGRESGMAYLVQTRQAPGRAQRVPGVGGPDPRDSLRSSRGLAPAQSSPLPPASETSVSIARRAASPALVPRACTWPEA